MRIASWHRMDWFARLDYSYTGAMERLNVVREKESTRMRKFSLLGVVITLLSFNLAAENLDQDPSTPMPVHLNHFFTVLDRVTYQAIEASDFMTREFAPNEYRKTVRGDRSYAGLYFYGKNTYFEFFDDESRGPGSLGFSMLALGVDQRGELSRLQAKLADNYPLSIRKVSRGYNDTQIAWFDQANLDNAKGSTKLGYGAWIMEYDPSFLSVWHPGESTKQGISRAALLERYTAILDQKPADPYFEDIVGLTFALDPVSLQDAIDLARAIGFREESDNGSYTFTGEDFVLHLEPVTQEGRGVRRMTMRISNSPEQKVHQLGKSTIVFGEDNLAHWTF